MNPLWTTEDIADGDHLLHLPFRFDDPLNGDAWRLDVQVPPGARLLAMEYPGTSGMQTPSLLFIGDPTTSTITRTWLFVGSEQRFENATFYVNYLREVASSHQTSGRYGSVRHRVLTLYEVTRYTVTRAEPHRELPAIARRTTFVEMFGHYRRP